MTCSLSASIPKNIFENLSYKSTGGGQVDLAYV